MLTGAKAQEYDRLRSLGHSVECAFDMADLSASCSCKPAEVESPKSTVKRRVHVEREEQPEEKRRGRPRKYASGASKQAAYRERHLVRLADLAGQIVAMEVDSTSSKVP
jgi:hypothetical protein